MYAMDNLSSEVSIREISETNVLNIDIGAGEIREVCEGLFVGKFDSMMFFFFSSRRRHTRSASVSWARRCV